MNKAIGDLWMPAVCFVLLLASIGQGLKQLFTSGSVTSPLAISIIWAVYNAIPPFLVLWYAIVGKGVMLQYLCRLLMLTSFFCGAAAIGLLWGLYPEEYNFNKVCLPFLQTSNPFTSSSHLLHLQSCLMSMPWRDSKYLLLTCLHRGTEY